MSDEKGEKKASVNWIFVIIGAALIVVGMVLLVNAESFKKNAVETEATIIRIDITRDSDDETQYNPIVQFTVGDVTYTGGVGYFAGMKKGDTVNIYYNPDDPQDFQDNSNSIIAVAVFLLLGIASSLTGFSPVITKKIAAIKKRRANT